MTTEDLVNADRERGTVYKGTTYVGIGQKVVVKNPDGSAKDTFFIVRDQEYRDPTMSLIPFQNS